MQAFQISTGLAPGPRNYVFVDEHNRHKRLKVMRACEGCRRRKIKCDAATTNTWPCGACKRLKLPCVPPVGGVDGDQASDQSEAAITSDASKGIPQQFTSQYDSFPSHYQPSIAQNSTPSVSGQYEMSPSQQSYTLQDYPYSQHSQQTPQNHLQESPAYNDYPYHQLDVQTSQSVVSAPKSPDQQTADLLMEQMGELKISINGVAPYARQQTVAGREPAVPIQDADMTFPSMSTNAGGQIRIPPALMPSDEDATESFELFFKHVHPYAPVLCRDQFYHQWDNDRSSISPLLLEAVFACAGRMSGEPVGDSPWLALANQHERFFLDAPRLSTIQALILLLKAREGSPKRGYYYKSWMLCKTIISMAKDLDLDEHHSIHETGEPCGFSAAECLAKTRVWQTLFVFELMIAGTQGRSELGVDPETVEYSTDPPNSHMNQFEAMISRQFAFFLRNSRNIRLCLGAYMKLKKHNKDWALDPFFVSHNETFKNWSSDLPSDLQVFFPADGSPPQLASHYIGNLHCHHSLGIIMMHRPQLLALKSSTDEQQWRYHFLICYNAAKKLCRLQEAILAQHDVIGLLCMQRGMSFTIYTILTSIMLHMIAITSPDPDLNIHAREYFIRHMRLLEKCLPEWPMPETEQQINNLRAAFSADLDQPFDLKPTFPYGSPSDYSPTRRTSEQPSTFDNSRDQVDYTQHRWPQQENPHFPTPPMSTGAETSHSHTPSVYQDYNVHQPRSQYSALAPTSYPTTEMSSSHQWNPAPIIDQFNTAFAIPASNLAPPSSSGYNDGSPMAVSQGNTSQYFATSPQTPNYDHNIYAQHQQIHSAPSQQTSQLTPQQQQSQHSHSTYFDPHLRSASLSNTQSQMPYTVGPSPYLPEDNMSMSMPIQRHNSNSNATPSRIDTQQHQHHQIHNPGMVYVTPKQWQQSVASVYDPTGLKRKWQYDTSMHGGIAGVAGVGQSAGMGIGMDGTH